jgi:hypothetical protein
MFVLLLLALLLALLLLLLVLVLLLLARQDPGNRAVPHLDLDHRLQ